MIGEKGHDLTPESAGSHYEPASQTKVFGTGVVSIDVEAHDTIEQLWGSIFFSPERSAPKSIVLTSAESGEGTTQISASLALVGSSTEHGLKITLVDFNTRKPKIAELFCVPPMPGVVDVITGTASVDESLIHTDNPRLDILPAGDLANVTMSSLRADRFKDMIGELTGQYDHVIIDAPPVNRYAAVQAIASLVDGVVLVIKAGETARESVAEAKKRIESAQGKIIGAVLNQRVFSIPDFLYHRL